MATPSEADTEAHSGAPLHGSKSFVKPFPKTPSSVQASEVDSEKQGAPESLLNPQSQVLVRSSFQENLDRDSKLVQEEHATSPCCMPESQASSTLVSTFSGDHITDERHPPSPQALGLGTSMVTKEDLQAPFTPQLRSVQTGSAEGVNFAASSNGCDSSLTKAVIDTTAPFESVKEAVTLFGERADWKPQSLGLEEKAAAPGFDISTVNEEMVHFKERLVAEEASIISILSELDKTKEMIHACKGKVPVTSLVEGNLLPLNQPEVVGSVAKDLEMNVLHELELVQKEIEDVLKDRAHIEALKQSVSKESEAAINAQKKAAMRVNDLMKEYASIRESFEAAKGALAKTESDISSLGSTHRGNPEIISGVEAAEGSDPGLAKFKSLDCTSDTSLEKLLKELGMIRGIQVNFSDGELIGAKVRLEQAKICEGNQMAALGRVLEHLDETKLNLKKAIHEAASLPPTINALQIEISKRRAELDSAHETDQIACATLASLQDELCNVRAQVLSAQAGETKARELKRSLPAAIKQLAVDADEAKAASDSAKEAARKIRLDLELAKAGTSVILSKLQAAQKEAGAARTSEAMALAEFKALSESNGELAGKTTVGISIEEYRTLHDAGRRAEEAAHKRVAVIFMQVEAATVNQQEAQGKLEVVLKELEMLRKTMEEAQKKANNAQVAKLSVEAELRKWRAEHEQWRKTSSSNPSSVNTSAAQSPRIMNGKASHGKALSHSFQGKAMGGLDSLSEVLTLKVPITERPVTVKLVPEMELPKKSKTFKKVSFFARVLSILVGKKKKIAM